MKSIALLLPTEEIDTQYYSLQFARIPNQSYIRHAELKQGLMGLLNFAINSLVGKAGPAPHNCLVQPWPDH